MLQVLIISAIIMINVSTVTTVVFLIIKLTGIRIRRKERYSDRDRWVNDSISEMRETIVDMGDRLDGFNKAISDVYGKFGKENPTPEQLWPQLAEKISKLEKRNETILLDNDLLNKRIGELIEQNVSYATTIGRLNDGIQTTFFDGYIKGIEDHLQDIFDYYWPNGHADKILSWIEGVNKLPKIKDAGGFHLCKRNAEHRTDYIQFLPKQ